MHFPRGRRLDPTLLLAFLLPVFAWAPLTYPGYFVFRSGFLSIYHQADLLNHFGDLSWVPAIGASYDLLRGERALPYLLGVIPTLLGTSPADATKWILAASLLAASVGTYAWVHRRLGRWPALIAATVYIYSPIVLATLYGHGVLAEAVLLGLLPWILWATEKALAGRVSGVVGLGLGIAAATWTQAGLTLWLIAILAAYLLIERSRRAAGKTLPAFAGLGAGLVLAVLGLLPTILAHGLGRGAPVDLSPQFLGVHQLLSAPDFVMAPGIGLGIVPVGLALFAYLLPPEESSRAINLDGPDNQLMRNFGLAVVGFLTLLSTSLSRPLWNGLPFLARTVSYPWQLLLLVGPLLAWLAALGAARLHGMLPLSRQALDEVALSAGVLAVALLAIYGTFTPETTSEPIDDAPLAIYGDNEIALLSVEMQGTPGPNGRVALEARWQALRPLSLDYTVFFHVVGENDRRYAQQDTVPQNGQLPTTRWPPGEIIVDRYEAVLSPDAPIDAGYDYWLGWYHGETGQRLRVGNDDKLVITPR